MFTFFQNSIKAKILVTVGVAVIGGVFLASIVSGLREAERQFQTRLDEITSIAKVLASSIKEDVETGERRKIALAINGIANLNFIKYAALRSETGRSDYAVGTGIVVSHDQHELDANREIGPYDAVYLGTYRTLTPVISGGRKIAEIELLADLSDLRHALLTSLLRALATGILAAIFGMVLSWYFQRQISTPIAELKTAMQQVQTSHDYSLRAERTSDDETGQLVDAFNNMLDKISRRDEKLARHREELETAVIERTADLEVAKKQAEQANAAKSDFLATMSHEIRTPMNGMLVTAELLAASNLPSNVLRKVNLIAKSGQSLLTIINDILDFSKIEAGKMDLEATRVEPSSLVDDALGLFAERAISKGIELTGFVAADIPNAIVGDPVRLTQILTNLINNALKFTETGGVTVRLTTSACSNEAGAFTNLRFEVEDTGIGIAKEKLETIFDAFSQADSSTTRSFGGTGIGLTICRRLVSQMGGQISADSTPGVGTTFKVDIPFEILEPAQRAACPETHTNIAVCLGPSMKRNTIVRYIEAAGFHADVIESKIADQQSQRDYAAIFSDQAVLTSQGWAETRPSACPIIIVRCMGQGSVQGLQGQGLIDYEMEAPISSRDIYSVLHAIPQGPESVRALAKETTSRAIAPTTTFQGLRVLAVDDSAVNREVLSEVLERLKISVTCVTNGAEAVEIVKRDTFDAVFMDASMPVMDGFEATTKIRGYEQETGAQRTPIIALTAHVVGDIANKWQSSGMDDCVTKPFTLQSIEKCLTQVFSDRAVTSQDTEYEDQANKDDVADDADDNTADILARLRAAQQADLMDKTVIEDIIEMQGPDGGLLQRIVEIYATHAPKALYALLEMHDAPAGADLAAAAHALKSMCRNVGAFRVGEICQVIEHAAEDGHNVLSQTDIEQEFRAAVAASIQQLNAFVQEHQASVSRVPEQKSMRQ